jgi:hypothetical protein
VNRNREKVATASRLDARNLAPRETMQQLEKDKDTVKGMVR